MNIYSLLKGETSQNELLNFYNATIIYEKLPKDIKGCVFNTDGINFIIINQFLSDINKRKTIIHELAHIELNQLEQYDKDLFETNRNKYEDEADKYIKNILNELQEEV